MLRETFGTSTAAGAKPKLNHWENAGVWKETEIQRVTEKEVKDKEKMCEGGKECGRVKLHWHCCQTDGNKLVSTKEFDWNQMEKEKLFWKQVNKKYITLDNSIIKHPD